MMWNGMIVYGETFSPDEQSEAWNAWEPWKGWLTLGARLSEARGLSLPSETAARGADRMLQRARKAGFASYSGGQWTKHTPDREFR